MKRSLLIVFCCLFFILSFNKAGICAYSWATLTDFKGIDQFSLFLTGNLEYYSSDIQGRVAVGRDAKLKNFSIGRHADSNKYSLIVGGNLTAEDGQVEKGSVYVGGDVNLTRVTINPYSDPNIELSSKRNVNLTELTLKSNVKAYGDLKVKKAAIEKNAYSKGDVYLTKATVKGNVYTKGKVIYNNAGIEGQIIKDDSFVVNSPFDFSAVNLKTISNNLYKDGIDLLDSDNDKNITIKLDKSGVYYYDIKASIFESISQFFIDAPSQTTIIINVIDDLDSITIADKDFRISGGITSDDILYNFIDDEDGNLDLDLNHFGLLGSILAPDGDIEFYEGVLTGSIMARNFTLPGIGTFNSGQINTAPLPSSFYMLIAAFVLLIFYKYSVFTNRSSKAIL